MYNSISSALEADSLDGPIYDVNTIKNYPSCHLLKSLKIVLNNTYLKEISKRDLEFNFSKVHIYRSISDIVNFHNCAFRFSNVRIIGIYKYGKIPTSYQNNCHHIEERRTGKKIEIDLSIVECFPPKNSTNLFFGNIKLTIVNNKTVPVIFVKFFQDLPNPESLETLFHLQKEFRPREFDSVISFDVSCDESVLDFNETLIETNDNTFDDFDTTLFVNKVESVEQLYYEIERLMNINID